MNPSGARLCDQFCVFSVGKSQFAVSAAAVREVANLVPTVRVPQSSSVLCGVCHHRNEFLPVLLLPALLGETSNQNVDPNLLLVLECSEGSWGLPISRAIGLESLEIASGGETNGDTPRPLVMGTASFRDGVVRILDVDRLYQTAVTALGDYWSRRETRPSPDTSAHSLRQISL